MPPARNWATSGRIKIERAKEHVRDFEVGTQAYLDRDPYDLFTYPNSYKRTTRVCVREKERLDLRWSAVLADAIHNWRSALDILWSLVMYPNTSRPPRKQYFPIFPDAEAYKAQRSREIKSHRKFAMDVLDATKPYRGGNDTLWALNEIDVRNKHEVLSLVVGNFQGLTVNLLCTDQRVPPERVTVTPKAAVYPLKNNAQLFEFGAPEATPGAQVYMKYQFTYTIAFGEGEVLEGKPVIEAVDEFSELVDGIALAFESAGLLP